MSGADATADAGGMPEGLGELPGLKWGRPSDYDAGDPSLPEFFRGQLKAEAAAVLARHDPAAAGWSLARSVSATYAVAHRRIDAYEFERGGERRVVVRTRERPEDDFHLADESAGGHE